MRLIKRFNDNIRVKIGNCYVRRDCIEIVNEETPGTIIIRTLSGSEFTLSAKEAKGILSEIGFNHD